MKLLTAQQIKELEAHTLVQQKITNADLMQRAASKTYNWIKRNLGLNYSYSIICGKRNNGRDGLVLAQLLIRNDYDIECVLLDISDQQTPEYEAELARLNRSDIKIKIVRRSEEHTSELQ